MEIPNIVETILDRLQTAGHQAYLVGGAVRDLCLKREPLDWDVATSAPVQKISSVFRDIKHFHLKCDTVTLVDGNSHYEITTFKGSAGVGTLDVDLGHRDFTINAMAYDRDRDRILDLHDGRSDIKKRLVRAVGSPEDRFEEDPLRLMRAVRFATELRFRVESETLKAIKVMAAKLASVAPERIREELMRILMTESPSMGFHLLVRTGLLKTFLPELLEGYRKRQNAYHDFTIFRHIMETIDGIEPDPVLRVSALLHDLAKPRVRVKADGEFRFFGHEEASALLAEDVLRRLKFSNGRIEQVKNLIAHHLIGYDSRWSDGAIRRLIRRVGPENMSHLLSLRKADLSAHGRGEKALVIFMDLERRIEAIGREPPTVRRRDLAINGRRIMEILGLPEGAEVGRILNELMERVTDHPELNTEENLTALLGKFEMGAHS